VSASRIRSATSVRLTPIAFHLQITPTATGAQKILAAATTVKTDLTSLSEASAADNAKAEGAITAATNLVKEYKDSKAAGRVGQITVDGLMGQVANAIRFIGRARLRREPGLTRTPALPRELRGCAHDPRPARLSGRRSRHGSPMLRRHRAVPRPWYTSQAHRV